MTDIHALPEARPLADVHSLRDAYRRDKAALLTELQASVASTRGIRVLLRKLSTLAGNLLQTLWQRAELPADMALVAVGGFGRDQLFPYSDVDV
ncbi:MAG: bifunctional uridylyltransferase/uridylyl-removing protein, partial [Acidovorax sp.]